jgi:hypothetical protein
MTFNDFNNLTAAQKSKLEEFHQIGIALGTAAASGPPNVTTVTDQQAKQAANWLTNEAMDLLNPTINGVRYVRQLYRDAAVKSYDDSVVAGP